MAQPGKYPYKIDVCVSQSTAERLEAIADATDSTVSRTARDMINYCLNQLAAPQRPAQPAMNGHEVRAHG